MKPVVVFLLSIVLWGCGQSGHLYLPDHAHPSVVKKQAG